MTRTARVGVRRSQPNRSCLCCRLITAPDPESFHQFPKRLVEVGEGRAQRRERLDREAKSRRSTRGGVTLEDFMAQAAAGVARTLNIVIKADQGGPAEALADALTGLATPEVKVDIVHRGVGAITENDINLASASDALVVGFNVRPQ